VVDLEHQIEDSKLISVAQLYLEDKQLLTTKNLQLEAEIDELKEANVTQQDELRNLCRKVWNTASVNDEVAKAQSEAMAAKREVTDHLVTIEVLANEKATLSVELSTERANKAELEQKLREELLRLQKSSAERISTLAVKFDESHWSQTEDLYITQCAADFEEEKEE
jgi:hypothetical protein